MRMAGDAQEILRDMQVDNANRLYCMKAENRHKAECAKYLFEGLGSGEDKPKPEQPKPEVPTEGNKGPANPKAVK